MHVFSPVPLPKPLFWTGLSTAACRCTVYRGGTVVACGERKERSWASPTPPRMCRSVGVVAHAEWPSSTLDMQRGEQGGSSRLQRSRVVCWYCAVQLTVYCTVYPRWTFDILWHQDISPIFEIVEDRVICPVLLSGTVPRSKQNRLKLLGGDPPRSTDSAAEP